MKSIISEPVIRIRPSRGWVPVHLRDLWAYHELFYFLTWRQIKVRYKQTVLGFAWAIIQPVMMMVVFSLFFGNLLGVSSEGTPYPLFSYAALLPWNLFAQGVALSSNSLVSEANLVKKVYFPRLAMPLSGILPPLVDFLIGFLVLVGLMFYFGYGLTLRMLWLPVFIILAMLTAAGIGLWLSAINAKYRDIGHIVPFLIQLGLFVSPVVYPASLLPQRFQTFYGLNPMAGVIEGFRWTLLGTEPPGYLIAVSAAIVILLLVSGLYYFRHREKEFADVL
ncbi:MAG: ABC transporter permease [Dehalococcoidia bacterium]|nr:MAG: ABC transporter permease [Dehalococcoidia bacterium]